MTAGNPVGYFTVQEILSRILNLQDISTLRLVFLTGPELLKMGYRQAFQLPPPSPPPAKTTASPTSSPRASTTRQSTTSPP